MANLTREESAERRMLRREHFQNGGVLTTSACGRVTVAMVPHIRNASFALMSTSIASRREKHLTLAIGELNALRRMAHGEACLVPWPKHKDQQWYMASDMADCIAAGL